MKFNFATAGLAMTLACVVLGAACNDDSNNVAPTPVPTATPTPAPEATPTPAPAPTPTPGPTAGTEVSFLGKVKRIDEGMLRVNADDVVVLSSTLLQREDGTPIAMNDLQVGSSVRVKGTYDEEGLAIIAERITLLS